MLQQAGQNFCLSGGAAAQLLLQAAGGIGLNGQTHYRGSTLANPWRQPLAIPANEALLSQAPQHTREAGSTGRPGEGRLAQGAVEFQSA